uniref:NTF2 domain-containing protein n=1 Tax=Timema bartmani TaxID=61472 RepID=A0A7R9HWX7_9NEOP|nr:unnamed protein product [Timema bartmani]
MDPSWENVCNWHHWAYRPKGTVLERSDIFYNAASSCRLSYGDTNATLERSLTQSGRPLTLVLYRVARDGMIGDRILVRSTENDLRQSGRRRDELNSSRTARADEVEILEWVAHRPPPSLCIRHCPESLSLLMNAALSPLLPQDTADQGTSSSLSSEVRLAGAVSLFFSPIQTTSWLIHNEYWNRVLSRLVNCQLERKQYFLSSISNIVCVFANIVDNKQRGPDQSFSVLGPIVCKKNFKSVGDMRVKVKKSTQCARNETNDYINTTYKRAYSQQTQHYSIPDLKVITVKVEAPFLRMILFSADKEIDPETREHVLFKMPLRIFSPKRPCGRPTDRSDSDLKTSVLWTLRSFRDTADVVNSGVWQVNPKPQTIANPIGSINLDVPEVPSNPAPGHIMLDQTNAHQVIAGGSYSSFMVLMSKNDYWHKFIVLDGAMKDGQHVMRLIMTASTPNNLIPVLYQQEGNNTFFLARNCSGAIEKLCYSMLLVADPQGELITLQIVLGFTPVNSVKLNMQDNFSKTLQRRFEPLNRSLDLSEFHSDPQLAKIVYCPLSQPKTLYYILALAKKALSNILELNLSHNDIEDIKSLDLFSNSPLRILDLQLAKIVYCPLSQPKTLYYILALAKKALSNILELNLSHNDIEDIKSLDLFSNSPLRILDLRYNQISDIDQLTSLQRVALVSLWLDRNPVCAKYGSENSYVNEIRIRIKTVKNVDGVVIGPIGFRRNHRNYMVRPSQNELVNDFIQHYFSLYDGDIRKKMQGLYHRDALYSLTATYLPGQTTSSTARLQEYMTESRNLRKLSDYTKSYNLLQHGQDRILEALCKLPPTQHDVYSFTVDVPFQSDNVLLINICGVFREMKATQTQPVRAFNRTFILLRMGEGEYQVTNEMVHISNATTEQNTKTFLHPLTSIPSVPTIASTADRVLTESEKAQMTQMFSQITEMNYQWSRKLIDQCCRSLLLRDDGMYYSLQTDRQTDRQLPLILRARRQSFAVFTEKFPPLGSCTARFTLPHDEYDRIKLRCLAEAYWDVKDGLITFVELYKLRRIPPEAFSKDEDSNKS